LKRIIFVDDEPKILEGLQRLLRPQRQQWEMVFAQSGEQALLELGKATFDVVVTDMRMPGMDGAALLEAIRARAPSTRCILLSGYAEDDLLALARADHLRRNR